MRAFLLALGLSALLPSLVAVESTWTTGWKDAAAQAATAKRPILADFTGSDWCGWGMKLKREVFTTPEFAEWAGRSVVLLEVDFPRSKPLAADLQRDNQAMAEKYDIEGFPTILILAADGRELGRLGYLPGGAKAWIAAAEQIMAKGQTVR